MKKFSFEKFRASLKKSSEKLWNSFLKHWKKFYKKHKKIVNRITQLLAVILVAVFLVLAMRVENQHYNYGIDVSRHNGNIKWSEVYSDGASFTIIRCGIRSYDTGEISKDKKFTRNIIAARYYDMDVGIYFYSQAVNEEEARAEAEFALKCAKGHKVTLPIFIDVEDTGTDGAGRADSLSAAERTEIVLAFAKTIREAGYTPGVYANSWYLQNNLNADAIEAAGIKVWLAEYKKGSQPSYEGKYDYWQYSNTGTVSGVSGDVDLNRKNE